jgi:hypothetical protein
MADAFSEFYSGAMAPPDKLGGRLVPSLAPSRGTLADMYRDILPANPSGGLTSRVVRTVPIGDDGNPISRNANDVIIDRPAPMFTASPTIDAANPIDAYRLGIAPEAPQNPAVAAIGSATPDLASLYANMLGRNSAGFTGPETLPFDSSVPLNAPQGVRGGASAAAPSAPVAPPPPTPMQSLAAMFTPAKRESGGRNVADWHAQLNSESQDRDSTVAHRYSSEEEFLRANTPR